MTARFGILVLLSFLTWQSADACFLFKGCRARRSPSLFSRGGGCGGGGCQPSFSDGGGCGGGGCGSPVIRSGGCGGGGCGTPIIQSGGCGSGRCGTPIPSIDFIPSGINPVFPDVSTVVPQVEVSDSTIETLPEQKEPSFEVVKKADGTPFDNLQHDVANDVLYGKNKNGEFGPLTYDPISKTLLIANSKGERDPAPEAVQVDLAGYYCVSGVGSGLERMVTEPSRLDFLLNNIEKWARKVSPDKVDLCLDQVASWVKGKEEFRKVWTEQGNVPAGIKEVMEAKYLGGNKRWLSTGDIELASYKKSNKPEPKRDWPNHDSEGLVSSARSVVTPCTQKITDRHRTILENWGLYGGGKEAAEQKEAFLKDISACFKGKAITHDPKKLSVSLGDNNGLTKSAWKNDVLLLEDTENNKKWELTRDGRIKLVKGVASVLDGLAIKDSEPKSESKSEESTAAPRGSKGASESGGGKKNLVKEEEKVAPNFKGMPEPLAARSPGAAKKAEIPSVPFKGPIAGEIAEAPSDPEWIAIECTSNGVCVYEHQITKERITARSKTNTALPKPEDKPETKIDPEVMRVKSESAKTATLSPVEQSLLSKENISDKKDFFERMKIASKAGKKYFVLQVGNLEGCGPCQALNADIKKSELSSDKTVGIYEMNYHNGPGADLKEYLHKKGLPNRFSYPYVYIFRLNADGDPEYYQKLPNNIANSQSIRSAIEEQKKMP